MNHALYAAASGMAAQQTNLDVIANNLANADVAGFKGAAASFTDIGTQGASGLGTASIGSHTLFSQGKLMKSGGPFDLAIDGTGFFQVEDPRGRRAYTRDGEFARWADGSVRNAQGWRLPGLRIPREAVSINVTENGAVIIQTAKSRHCIGSIRVATFAAPEKLQSRGGTLFVADAACGPVNFVVPGGSGKPKIMFGMLEQSNVSIVESMMQILAAQRAYEANAKGIQAADEMMRIANNLHRG